MSDGFRIGRRLGIDWGSVRIGVASCDPQGIIATPVTTVPGSARSIDELVALVEEYEPIEVVIGLPRSLRGGEGPSAQRIRSHAVSFAQAVGDIPVRFVDERLTTVSAANVLRASGRSERNQRSVIDQVAAVTILEHALEIERQTGGPPGPLVTEEERS